MEGLGGPPGMFPMGNMGGPPMGMMHPGMMGPNFPMQQVPARKLRPTPVTLWR